MEIEAESSLTPPPPKIQLLEYYRFPNDDATFRLLVDDKVVKYAHVTKEAMLSRYPAFIEMAMLSVFKLPIIQAPLPPIPPGDWRVGEIDLDKTTGMPQWNLRLSNAVFPRGPARWHPKKYSFPDEIKVSGEFKPGKKLYEVVSPEFPTPALVKMNGFAYDPIAFDREVKIYEFLEDLKVAPAFYGHVVEGNRTVGFVMEWVQGARTATTKDFIECRAALGKLHELGFKHGNVRPTNFLIKNNRAYLIDYENATPENDAIVQFREFRQLEKLLAALSEED